MSKTFTANPNYSRTSGGRARGSSSIRGTRGRGVNTTPSTSSRAGRSTGTNNRTRPTAVNTNLTRGTQRTPTNMYQSPGYGRGQGAGRGRAMPVPGQQDSSSQPGFDNNVHNPDDTSSGGTQPERQIERRDAYSVIRPNQEKRNKIAAQAQKEEEAYRQHKESKKVEYVSYSGTVGGGGVSEATAKKQFQHQHARAQLNSRQKAQQYREKEKQREDEINDKKKMEQRQKSEANKIKDEQIKERNDQKYSRERNAWLDGLDRQTKESKAKKILSSTAAQNYTEPSTSRVAQYPPDSDSDSLTVEGATGGAEGRHGDPSDVTPLYNDPSDVTPLDELVRIFPQYERTVLEDVLLNCNGSVEHALSLLQP